MPMEMENDTNGNQLRNVRQGTVLAEESCSSNGRLVRFVGQNRIRDGVLLRVVLAAKATLVPWLAYDLLCARRARRSWQESRRDSQSTPV